MSHKRIFAIVADSHSARRDARASSLKISTDRTMIRKVMNHSDPCKQIKGPPNTLPIPSNYGSSYNTQNWTALFRAFSSHRQPSASLTKLFPSWTRLLAELDKP